MPEVNLKYISSVSSEDPKQRAENLLEAGDYRGWRCASAGEKSASVIIQLERAEKIHQIDIGNKNSAFVEVLVGKSATTSVDWQVILVASSFMIPAESRSGTNTTRVRLFPYEQLSASARDTAWDSVKIVCTQPFTKTVQYGLSFIKLHSAPSREECTTSLTSKPVVATKQLKLGAFSLKDEDEDDISTGSLFTQCSKTEAPLTGAAAVRAAARLADESQPTTSQATPAKRKAETETESKVTPQPIKRSRTFDSTEGKSENTRDIDTAREKPSKPRRASSENGSHNESTKAADKKTKASTSQDVPEDRTKENKTTERKASLSSERREEKKEKKKKERPFSRLMRGVVFVLSGYENPERGKIRDKALAMGAEYKPNWNKSCTHLICAFAKTPKYNVVKGRGRIVDKHWILDSHKQQRLLSWRKYRVGKALTPDNSTDEGSTEEEEEEEWEPAKKRRGGNAETDKRKHDSGSEEEAPKVKASLREARDRKTVQAMSSVDEDTDDEINRIREDKKRKKGNDGASHCKEDTRSPAPKQRTEETDDDIYDADTDTELPQAELANGKKTPMKNEKRIEDGSGVNDLSDYFSGQHILLYGDMSATLRRQLTRYVTAYAGHVEQYMGPEVTHVVTEEGWDDNFDKALEDNSDLVFVRPQWVFECHDQQKIMSHKPFSVSRNS